MTASEANTIVACIMASTSVLIQQQKQKTPWDLSYQTAVNQGIAISPMQAATVQRVMATSIKVRFTQAVVLTMSGISAPWDSLLIPMM